MKRLRSAAALLAMCGLLLFPDWSAAFKSEDFDKFVNRQPCAGCDLGRIYYTYSPNSLAQSYLPGADMREARLDYIDLSGSNMKKVNLNAAILVAA